MIQDVVYISWAVRLYIREIVMQGVTSIRSVKDSTVVQVADAFSLASIYAGVFLTSTFLVLAFVI